MPPLVFDYLDTRSYLEDLYCDLKRADPSFSYRAFARMAGSPSPNFLQHVRASRLRFTAKNLNALSRSLPLTASEKRYLAELLRFERARSSEEKDRAARNLLGRRQKEVRSRTLDRDEYDFYRYWYHSAIRALIGCGNLRRSASTAAQVAARLVPPITEKQAAASLELLLRLNLIRVNGKGVYEQSEGVITSGDNLRSLKVLRFQKETLKLATRALETIPMEQRDISTLTLNISLQGFERIRARVKDMRREIIEMARQDANEDRVYHLGVQFFPMATLPADNGGGL